MQTKAQVLEIARNTAALVELGKEIVADDVVLDRGLRLSRLWRALGGDQGGYPPLARASKA